MPRFASWLVTGTPRSPLRRSRARPTSPARSSTAPLTGSAHWVLRAAEGLFDEVRSEPDIWRPILGLIRGAPAVVSERIAESREVIREQLAAGLDAGLKLRGGPDLDSQVISHLVLATAEEFGRLILEEPPRYDKQRILETLRQLLAAIQ